MPSKSSPQFDLALANSQLAGLTVQYEEAQTKAAADRRLAETAKAEAKRARRSYKHARKAAKESRKQAKALRRQLRDLVADIAAAPDVAQADASIPKKSHRKPAKRPSRRKSKISPTTAAEIASTGAEAPPPTPVVSSPIVE